MSDKNSNTNDADSSENEGKQASRHSRIISRRDLLTTTTSGVTALSVGVEARSGQVTFAAPGEQEWVFETGARVFSSPTVANGTVYVGSRDKNLYAVDADTGDKQWSFRAEDQVNSSPAVADGTVCVGTANPFTEQDRLYAVDAASGNQQWSFDSGLGWYSSPTIADGIVYAQASESASEAKVYSVDIATGNQLWGSKIPQLAFSSPTVANGTVYVGGTYLYALDATTGDRQWTYKTIGNVKSSPTVANGTVYVGSENNSLHAIDAATGDLQWQFISDDGVRSSPTVVNKTVYVGSQDGNLYAVDAATGDQQWILKTDDFVYSSPTVANGTVYVGSGNGRLYAVNKDTGQQKWVFKAGSAIFSSPTVTDGIVYVGCRNGNVYAVGTDHTKSSSGSRVLLETLGHHEQSPTAQFILTPAQPETGTPVIFDASSSSGESEITEYEWDFGNGEDSTTISEKIKYKYKKSGKYKVTLTVTDTNGLTDTATQTIRVLEANQSPTANFSLTPSNPTVGNKVSFDASGTTDDSSIVGYEWDFNGDGTIDATGQQATYTYDSPGVYTVTLTVTDDDGATASSKKTISVSAKNTAPTPAFTLSPSEPAVGSPVSFDASSTTDDSGIAGYEWDFTNDGTIDATGQRVTYTYNQTGTYTVALTVTDTDGATATTTKLITVSEKNQSPTAAFSFSPSSPTAGMTVSFDASSTTDNSGIASYEWDFTNDESIDTTGQQVTYTYNQAGTYTVALTVTDTDGATDTTTQVITVSEKNQSPTAAFSFSPSSPTTETTVSFDASNTTDDSGILRYQWDFDGDGTVDATGSQQTYQYDAPGTYTAKLTVRDEDGATDSATRSLTVSEPETTDKNTGTSGSDTFSYSPSAPTVDTAVTFKANGFPSDSAATSYRWDFNSDGSPDAFGPVVSHTFSTAGPHTVSLTVKTQSGDTQTVRRTITINSPPTAQFSVSPTPSIVKEPTTFSARNATDSDGSIQSYEWDFDGNGNPSKTGRVVTHTFSKRGRPTVTLRVTDDQGATATRSRSLTVQRAATFSLQLRDTTITTDEQTTAAITVNNLLGTEKLFTQLELDLPSGWDVTFVDAASSGGGTATEIFETQPGQTRTIRARIAPNDTGEFTVGGRAFYFVGDRGPPRHTKQLKSRTLTVTDGDTEATSGSASTLTDDQTATDQSTSAAAETSASTPGFGLGAGATALGAGLGLLRSLDLLDDDHSESDD